MRSAKDVEAYLEKLQRPYELIAGSTSTYVVKGPQHVSIVIRIDPPLAVFRANIGEIPKDAPVALFRRVLELNATGLVHVAYGLEGDRIVLGSALELENLDFNELEATLDEFDLALAEQAPLLLELAKGN